MGSVRLYKLFHVLPALLYMLLGISAAWHAPHFSQARQAIDVDRHAEHEAVFEGACALCTVKTAPQLGVARFAHGPVASIARAPEALCVPFAADIRVLAGSPRAPPPLLS